MAFHASEECHRSSQDHLNPWTVDRWLELDVQQPQSRRADAPTPATAKSDSEHSEEERYPQAERGQPEADEGAEHQSTNRKERRVA
jgi:hypothetical protein